MGDRGCLSASLERERVVAAVVVGEVRGRTESLAWLGSSVGASRKLSKLAERSLLWGEGKGTLRKLGMLFVSGRVGANGKGQQCGVR
jgi:hypothetical protein